MTDVKQAVARLADICRYSLRVIEASPAGEVERILEDVREACDLLGNAAEFLEENEEEQVGPVVVAMKPQKAPSVEFRAVA